jgi:leucyl-tRNA synthetase
VIWTEEGVQAASRFLQRVWRIVGEIAGRDAGEGDDGAAALAIRKAAHRALAAVEADIERLGFNRCVAHVYTLANVLAKALEGSSEQQSGSALKEAGRILVQLIAPMMPHLAEECWQALGETGLVAEAAWPVADPALLEDDAIVLPVQVNGRKRADLTVAKTASQKEIEEAVLALDGVARALNGKPARKIIVVPGRIVNVVA